MRKRLFMATLIVFVLFVLTSASAAFAETGTVKWFDSTKGYGFISPCGGGPDVYVHISAVERAGLGGLATNDCVVYEVAVDPRRGKSSAENLRLPGDSPSCCNSAVDSNRPDEPTEEP